MFRKKSISHSCSFARRFRTYIFPQCNTMPFTPAKADGVTLNPFWRKTNGSLSIPLSPSRRKIDDESEFLCLSSPLDFSYAMCYKKRIEISKLYGKEHAFK